MKRALDIVIAALLLVLSSPVLVAAAVAIRLDPGGDVFHRARRAGKDGREFVMYKLRTMRPGPGPRITSSGDPRITRVGRFLRRTRIDELPQLWNVLRGEMSLVGPRPEDPTLVALYSPEQRAVLAVAPGITGPAQLRFAREDEVLPADDPEGAYVRDILPHKIRVDLDYVRSRSTLGDLAILARTAWSAVRPRQGPRSAR